MSVWEVFQLVGAPLPFSHHVAFLDREFPEHWVGREETHSLAPSFSRFVSSGLFLVGFVKYTVNHEKVKNVNELHDRIIRGPECVTSEVVANTWQETEYHLDVCCATNGAHIHI
jgi:hypothetical protein